MSALLVDAPRWWIRIRRESGAPHLLSPDTSLGFPNLVTASSHSRLSFLWSGWPHPFTSRFTMPIMRCGAAIDFELAPSTGRQVGRMGFVTLLLCPVLPSLVNKRAVKAHLLSSRQALGLMMAAQSSSNEGGGRSPFPDTRCPPPDGHR
jgi:hypothetical protein